MHDGSGLKVPQRMVIRDRNGNENGYQHGERPNMGLIIGLKPKRWPTKRRSSWMAKRFQQEKPGGISGGINPIAFDLVLYKSIS